MTHQNNAAQPVLTDDEREHLFARYFSHDDPCRRDIGALMKDVESALLSKLRAPVADHSAMRQALEGMLAVFACGAPPGESPTIDAARAALASAPVAGEALFWYRPCSDGGYEGPLHSDRIEDVRKRSGAWVPLYAAPQASEAVRNALADLLTECVRADAQAQQEVQRGFVHPHIVSRARAALKTQADKDGAPFSCPSGDGSLRHPCAVHPAQCADGGVVDG